MYKEVFALRLFARRKELGLSQITVSNETEITQSNISKFEQGKLEPSLETLGKLANYYQVSIDWLLGNPYNDREGNIIKTVINQFYDEAEDILRHTEYQKFSQDEEREVILENLQRTKNNLLEKYKEDKQ